MKNERSTNRLLGASDLDHAVRVHHHEIHDKLDSFLAAWLGGDARLGRRRFGMLARAVGAHFDWEQHELVDPLRARFTVYDFQMIQRDGDSHRQICSALARLKTALHAPAEEEGTSVETLARRAGDLLESHRVVFETQLRSRLSELLSTAAGSSAAHALSSRSEDE